MYFDGVGELDEFDVASAVDEVDHLDEFLGRLRSSRSSVEDHLELAADSATKTSRTSRFTKLARNWLPFRYQPRRVSCKKVKSTP